MSVRWFNRSEVPTRIALMDSLEPRQLFAEGPRVDFILPDHRGRIELGFDRKVLKTSMTEDSVQLFTAGDDEDFNTADDVQENIKIEKTQTKLIVSTKLDPGTEYRIFLDGSVIEGLNGEKLDGEFKGQNKPSGNGTPRGDFEFVTAEREVPRAIIVTDLGTIEIRLFEEDAPESVENFIHYLDNAAWDRSFVNRSLEDFVLQMGGFAITKKNTRVRVEKTNDSPKNEPGISNTRGTVAWAKRPSLPNSASNEFFFNLDDNGGTAPNGLDFQNGGFTVFGKVTEESLKVLNRIEKLNVVEEIAGLQAAFSDLPIKDIQAIALRGGFIDPKEDLVKITRATLIMDAEEVPEEQEAGFAMRSSTAFASSSSIGSEKNDDEDDVVSL